MGDQDKDLLEFAAKAAGLQVCNEVINDDGLNIGEGNGDLYVWNPLTDDGDALRLAVKLGFLIGINRGAEKIIIETGSDDENHFFVHEYEWDDENSHIEATRRAIVGAAAEIGRSMQ